MLKHSLGHIVQTPKVLAIIMYVLTPEHTLTIQIH